MKLPLLIFVGLFTACGGSDQGSETSNTTDKNTGKNTTPTTTSTTSTNKLAGTIWTYSGSEWTYESAHNKKYQEDELTLIFNADGTGTFENAFENQYYVYNIITEKWQTNAHNVKDWKYTFSYTEPVGSTITLSNYMMANDVTGITVTITGYTGSSLVLSDHTLIKQ
jgi:hypothetical protein